MERAADVAEVMGQGSKDMCGFIVLAFMLGQFIALFNWTGVGSALAVGGAEGLEAIGLTGFVPMFTLLGFEPGFIQGAFRVGDSATQVITPMNPHLFVFLMMLKRYEPQAGTGNVISRMLPFVVPFWVAWVLVLAVFCCFGLDMAPDVGIRIP